MTTALSVHLFTSSVTLIPHIGRSRLEARDFRGQYFGVSVRFVKFLLRLELSRRLAFFSGNDSSIHEFRSLT